MRQFGDFGPGICCFSDILRDRNHAAVDWGGESAPTGAG